MSRKSETISLVTPRVSSRYRVVYLYKAIPIMLNDTNDIAKPIDETDPSDAALII